MYLKKIFNQYLGTSRLFKACCTVLWKMNFVFGINLTNTEPTKRIFNINQEECGKRKQTRYRTWVNEKWLLLRVLRLQGVSSHQKTSYFHGIESVHNNLIWFRILRKYNVYSNDKKWRDSGMRRREEIPTIFVQLPPAVCP